MDERTIPGQGVKRTRPCAQCRLRKIKCDKQRPCESCRRSDIDCIYDGSHPESNVESRSELLDRVDHLEAQLQAVTSILRAKGAGPSVATVVPDEAPSLPECSCGRQILGTHFSIHYDYYMNWVELFPKLRDIYFETTAAYEDAGGPKEVCPPVIGGIQADHFALKAYQPPDAEAHLLVDIFFENVNPFVRVLNKEIFFADLAKFRANHLANPDEFNAQLFSIYGLAIASLTPRNVLSLFGVEREWLLCKYQEAQEFALRRIDFLTSNRLSVFQDFLYYVTFLFARGYYQTATAMIGLAARNAQRLGLHKDPSYFNYSEWVSEWRRRLWNQLILLNEKAISLQGAISILEFAWDTQLPGNSNDEAWNTSPLAKPSDAPVPTDIFSQMTFTLLKRAVLAVLCPLRQSLRSRPYAQQLRHIEVGRKRTKTFFAAVMDDMKPLAAFVDAVVDIEFRILKLMAGEALIRFGDPLPTFRFEHFMDALQLLEQITSLEVEATNHRWMWLFRAEPPLLATAIVLSHVAVVQDENYDSRVRTQIDIIFDRYINDEGSYKPPILASLHKLRDIFKSTRAQTTIPIQMDDRYVPQEQGQFDYFISGEEPDLLLLGPGYHNDLFPITPDAI